MGMFRLRGFRGGVLRGRCVNVMAHHRYVDFDIDQAKALADLNGVKFDLQGVIELSDEISSIINDASFNSTVLDALCSALVVKYFRCFGFGVRGKLDIENITSLTEDEVQLHKLLKNLRDKHIVHSVNSFEENYVVAYLNPEERGKKINSISVQHHRMIALSEYDIDFIKRISSKILTEIKVMIESEKKYILELARKEDIDEMYKREAKTIIPGDWLTIHKRRTR